MAGDGFPTQFTLTAAKIAALLVAGGLSLPDSKWTLTKAADSTAKQVHSLTNYSTATTRTITWPDASGIPAISAAALTSGRVPFATTGGLLIDSATLQYATAAVIAGNQLSVGDGSSRAGVVIASPNTTGNHSQIVFLRGGNAAANIRWNWTTFANEGGSDTGSNLYLQALNDSGTGIDYPIQILRVAGGAMTFTRSINFSPGADASSVYTFGTTNAGAPTAIRTTSLRVWSPSSSSFTGQSSLILDSGSTYLYFREEGVDKWLFYHLRGDQNFYFRDTVNARMQCTLTPGSTSDAAIADFNCVGKFHSTTDSTSTTTGGLIVDGGGGFAKQVSALNYLATMGTITSAKPVIDSTVTWNSGGTTFTGWKLNVSDTASASNSQLLLLQVGGLDHLNVLKDGRLVPTINDAVTGSVSSHVFQHNTTGTPAAGYGTGIKFEAESSTTANQSLGKIDFSWADATDASRAGRATFFANYTSTARECFRIEANSTAPMIGFLGAAAVAQQARTVDPTDVLVNVGLQASGGGKIKTWRKIITGVNVNSAGADVGTFTNLPAKYRVLRLQAFDGSTNLTTATIDLRTATGGGGTALVAAASLAACTAAAKYSDLTLAAVATTDYQTTATLTARNVTAQGAAATVSLLLEVIDLT